MTKRKQQHEEDAASNFDRLCMEMDNRGDSSFSTQFTGKYWCLLIITK